MFKVAIPCYLESDCQEILKISEDSDKLDPTWAAWQIKKRKRKSQLEQMGMKTIDVHIHPSELLKYCKEKNLPIIGSSRADMANTLMNKK